MTDSEQLNSLEYTMKGKRNIHIKHSVNIEGEDLYKLYTGRYSKIKKIDTVVAEKYLQDNKSVLRRIAVSKNADIIIHE